MRGGERGSGRIKRYEDGEVKERTKREGSNEWRGGGGEGGER